jgi:protein phosphatase PTC1
LLTALLDRRKPAGDGFEAVLLSEKHLPTTVSEKARIEAMGGLVFKGRVFGTLAVSRALGYASYICLLSSCRSAVLFVCNAHFRSDAGLKNPDYVSAEPHILSLELQSDDRFMVLACDGLWDKFSYTDAVEYVAKLHQ